MFCWTEPWCGGIANTFHMMWGRQLCVLGTGAPLKNFKADKVQAQDKANSSVAIDSQEQLAAVHSHGHKPSLEEHLFKKHRDKNYLNSRP